MAIIGVDIDLTVVNSDQGWFDWCNEQLIKMGHEPVDQQDLIELGQVSYDFAKVFPALKQYGRYILDYWRQETLYDDMLPIKGSVEALELLSHDHDIVFVTALKGNHHKSKYELVKRNFPFMKGFIGTKEKHFARIDVLIDDRINNLNNVAKHGIIPIQYDTIYTQDEEQSVDMAHITSWTDVLCSGSDTMYNALFDNIRKAKL